MTYDLLLVFIFFPRKPDAENRARGLAHHFFCRASKQDMIEPGAAMRADDNQIHLFFFGDSDNLEKWRPAHDHALVILNLPQLRFAELFHLLLRRFGDTPVEFVHGVKRDLGVHSQGVGRLLNHVEDIKLGIIFSGEGKGLGQRPLGILGKICRQ